MEARFCERVDLLIQIERSRPLCVKLIGQTKCALGGRCPLAEIREPARHEGKQRLLG
uniref:Uncharacterized protein n=1 Tax=viral metagenome TaxID=1070528 RepID=A0A6M3MBB7_9ZZZZ